MCVMPGADCIWSLYKLLGSYRDRRTQNAAKHLRWSVLQKEQCPSADMQPYIMRHY